MSKAGRYHSKRQSGSHTAKEVMWLRGSRKPRKYTKNTCKSGEVKVIKAADPEKIKAWHESKEYKALQKAKTDGRPRTWGNRMQLSDDPNRWADDNL